MKQLFLFVLLLPLSGFGCPAAKPAAPRPAAQAPAIPPTVTIPVAEGTTEMKSQRFTVTDANAQIQVPAADVTVKDAQGNEVPLLSPGASGVYQPYSTAALAAARARGDKVVLFFHAAWCPYCQAADKAFTTNESELPKGVTLLKADYDTEQNLKTQFAISYQHTFVQIDADGNVLSKWSGGDIPELEQYLK
ncbi:thioredoxin family protein [Candidatus Uhrbacteria bacterium]|nr:thioredoxin family protein [Candidatus Uhrbacteria bacterium]